MGETRTLRFRDNTGGVNLISSDFRINDSETQTEMVYIQNFETYQEGGYKSQNGNRQMNSGVTDETEILGIGQFQDGNGDYFSVYTKASGKAYVIPEDGGAETEIKTGLSTTAQAKFVEFNGKIYCFNGADTPWYYDGTGTGTDISTPPAAWSTKKPHTAVGIEGGRILAAAGSSLYWCKSGDANDWTAASDAGSVTDPYGDTSDIKALADYGSKVSVHTGKNRVYLFSGNTNDTYNLSRIASNQSAVGKYGVCTVNASQYFYTQNGILPLITTDLGVVKLGEGVDIARKIAPFINGTEAGIPINPVNPYHHKDTILLPYDAKNEMVSYYKTSLNGPYDTAAIFNFNKGGWVFRKMTPVTAATLVNGKIFTGTSDGKILQEFTGTTAVGMDTITKRLVSPFYSFGAPEVEKRILRMFLWFRSSTPAPATLKFRRNYANAVVLEREVPITLDPNSTYGVAVYGQGMYAQTVVSLENFPLNITGDSFQWEMVSEEPAFDFRLVAYAFEVEYGDAY